MIGLARSCLVLVMSSLSAVDVIVRPRVVRNSLTPASILER